MSWQLAKTVTGFSTVTAKDSKSLRIVYARATFNRVYYEQFTLLAAGTATKDLYSFTDVFGAAVTATKLGAWYIGVTGNTGVLKVEPGASNPLAWQLGGTTAPKLTLTPNATYGAVLMGANPGAFTMSTTARNLLFTNSGAATVTVTFAAIVGD